MVNDWVNIDETMDLGALPQQWEQMDLLAKRMQTVSKQPPHSAVLTDRRFDESQPAGHRGWINAHAYIQGGMEHLDALRFMLSNFGATPRVPWTILRSVFESGFWAAWLLDPDDGLERRRRGLRLEVRGSIERKNVYDAHLKHDPHERDRVASGHLLDETTYRREATQLGMTWEATKRKITTVDELPKLSAVAALGSDSDPMIGIWRSLSGLQHGYAYALVMNSTRVGEQRTILGGAEQTLTISDHAFQAQGVAANHLMVSAMNLYIRRSTRTS